MLSKIAAWFDDWRKITQVLGHRSAGVTQQRADNGRRAPLLPALVK